jgi:hypothetical protein
MPGIQYLVNNGFDPGIRASLYAVRDKYNKMWWTGKSWGWTDKLGDAKTSGTGRAQKSFITSSKRGKKTSDYELVRFDATQAVVVPY